MATTTTATKEIVSEVKAMNLEGVFCMNCTKPASRSLMCPKCKELGVSDAFFCSKDCFAKNYKSHAKKLHTKPGKAAYNFPPGTVDGFAGLYNYSGPLRAVQPLDGPLPQRTVPRSIPYPDYATEGMDMPDGLVDKGKHVANVISSGLKRALTDRKGKILTPEEIEGMRKVCRLAREVLDIAAAAIRPGITTIELDEIVHNACIERDSYPSPLGYHRFPRSVCTSVNEVICHGIPDSRPLEEGDIINLDVTLFHGGFHGDLNATYPVGKVSDEKAKLISVSRSCLDEAIRVCKPGFPIKDVGEIIEKIAKRNGFSTNRTYVGHGIRQLFHCAPNIPHYAGNRATGVMKEGMVFTIEPMICVGNQKETHWPDNWTAATIDGKPSAQFEETLLITKDGVEVLTAAPGWSLPEPPAQP